MPVDDIAQLHEGLERQARGALFGQGGAIRGVEHPFGNGDLQSPVEPDDDTGLGRPDDADDLYLLTKERMMAVTDARGRLMSSVMTRCRPCSRRMSWSKALIFRTARGVMTIPGGRSGSRSPNSDRKYSRRNRPE